MKTFLLLLILVTFCTLSRCASPPDPVPEYFHVITQLPLSPALRPIITIVPLSASPIPSPSGPSNADQVLSAVYDSINTALRINGTLSGSGAAGPSNTDQILSAVFDSANNALKVNCVTGCSGGVGGSSIFTSFQLGSNTALTGTGLYVQLTGTAPISFGTQTGTGASGTPFIIPINCAVASGSQAGCLASSDWTTFNSKQAPLSNSSPPTHQFVNSFTAPNTFGYAQPAFTDLSGSLTSAQLPSGYTPGAGIPNSTGSGYTTSYGVSGTGSVALTTSAVFTTPNLGTPSAIALTHATSLPCTALPSFTGDTTTSSGSCVTATAKINGTAFIGVSGDLVGFGGANTPMDSGVLISSLLANPMTTIGDVIGGGMSGAPTRVPGGLTGQSLVSNHGSTPSFLSATVTGCNGSSPVSSSTYTILADSATALRDRGTTCDFTSGAATVTIPDPGDTGVGVGFPVVLHDVSAGTLTVNRETSATFTILAGDSTLLTQTSFTLQTGQTAHINSTSSTNYNVVLDRGTTGTLVSVTSTYSVPANVHTVLANGTFTVTLLSAGANIDQTFRIKNSGTGVITVSAGGVVDIDGSTTHTLATLTSGDFVWDGTQYWVF